MPYFISRLMIMKKNRPEWYALITNFMDHKDQRKSYPEYYQGVKTNIIDVLLDNEDLAEDFDEEEMFRIVGIIDTNSQEIKNRNGVSIKGIFPLGLYHELLILVTDHAT